MSGDRKPDDMSPAELLGALQEKVKAGDKAGAIAFIDLLKEKRRDEAEGGAAINAGIDRLMGVRLEDDAGKPRDPGDIEADIDAALVEPFAGELTPIPTDFERRKWIAPGWLPANRLSAIYGAGAVGKSRLALQIAAAAAGVVEDNRMLPWDPAAGGDIREQGDVPQCETGKKTLLVTWEDERAELGRRWRMLHNAGAVETWSPPDRIQIIDMREVGGPLWAPRKAGTRHISTAGEWTDAGLRLHATLEGFDLCIIDPLAAAYASSEIDRALVRQFTAAFDRIAEETECAVVLCGHPPKSDSKFSGSTDWRASVRSMLVLELDDPGSDDPGGRDDLKAPALKLDKASYAREGGRIWLRNRYETGGGDELPALAWFATTQDQARENAKKNEGGGRTTPKKPRTKSAGEQKNQESKPEVKVPYVYNT